MCKKRNVVTIKFEDSDGKPLSSTEVLCEPGQEGGVIRNIWNYLEETYPDSEEA